MPSSEEIKAHLRSLLNDADLETTTEESLIETLRTHFDTPLDDFEEFIKVCIVAVITKVKSSVAFQICPIRNEGALDTFLHNNDTIA
jgi:hypothetical protein